MKKLIKEEKFLEKNIISSKGDYSNISAELIRSVLRDLFFGNIPRGQTFKALVWEDGEYKFIEQSKIFDELMKETYGTNNRNEQEKEN